MALVSKILEATLTAGNTSVTFTDADIPNSLIRVFSSDSNIIPESRILSGTSLTVVYAPQTSNIDVALEIVKQGLDIVDNVLSEDTDKALSAKQGYLLSAAIGDVNDRIDNLVIPEDLTDLGDVNVTSIQDGQVLAWDDISQKFVNVDQSEGGSVTYTSNEQLIGQYMGKNLYTRTFEGTPQTGQTPNVTTIGSRSGLGITDIVFVGGYLYSSTGLNSILIPSFVNNNTNSGLYIDGSGNIKLYNSGSFTKYSLTIWYLKD